MPRRKDESFDARRQQIIDGALAVFSTKGFATATNKDVASAAGINSPGLIYHYFKDKADLLQAIAERYAPPLQLVAHPETVMDLPPREALTRFADAYLRLIDDPKIGAFIRLVVGQALRDPEFARLFGRIGPVRFLGLLSRYLERQMDAGVLRRANSMHAARCFLGPLAAYLLMHNVLQIEDPVHLDRDAMIAATLDLYLNGLATERTPE